MRLPPVFHPHPHAADGATEPAPGRVPGPPAHAAPAPAPAPASATAPPADARQCGLRRKMRSSAVSVTLMPGYVHTRIAPMGVERDAAPPASRAAAPASGQPALQRIEDMTAGLTRKLYPGATRHTTLDAVLREPAVFTRDVAALFAGPADAAAGLARALLAAAGDSGMARAPLAGAWQAALALAGTGATAAEAHAALDHLRGAFSLSDGAGQSTPATPAQRHAWHAARLLGHTPTGFAALERILQPAGVSNPANPANPANAANAAAATASTAATANDRQLRRESLRTFLQASHQLAAGAEDRARSATPAAQLAYARHPPRRGWRDGDMLATGALLCAARLQDAPHATAADIGHPDQVADYVAWRSGFRHDGEDTPFAHTRARLAKFGTWAQRADQRAEHPRHAFHPARLFGRRKSPLTAMTQGDGGATLPLLTQQAALCRQAVHATIDTLLRHQRALLGRPVTPAQRATLRLREQALLHWKSSAAQQVDRITLGEAERRAISAATSMAALHDPVQPALGPDRRALAKLKVLKLDTLERWAEEAARMGAAGPVIDQVREARRHAVKLRRAVRAAPRDQRRLQGLAGLHARLRDVIDHTPLGNNVRYFDGGMYGLNANMTLNQAEFPHHGVEVGVLPSVGVKAKRGRYAFVEVGSSSYGGEVYMGTETRHSTGAALGVFAGAAVGVHHTHLAAYGGFGAAYSDDRSTSRGVIVRSELQRDSAGAPTDSWRRQAGAVADFLFQRAAVPDDGADGHWRAFSARFFRDTDISVDWRDQRRSGKTVSVSATLTARLSVTGLHLGPSLVASHDRLLAGKNERVDANGWLRGVERSRARSASTTVSAALMVGTSGAGHFSSKPGHPQSVSVTGVPLFGAAVVLAPAGGSVTLRMVEDRDGFNPKFIRRLVEFVDPASFEAYAESLRPAMRLGPLGTARLNDYLGRIARGARRGNQSYGASSKLLPEIADLVTAHHDELTMRRLTGRDGGAVDGAVDNAVDSAVGNLRREQLEGEIVRLLQRADSWKASAYYSYEINTSGYNAGPSMMLEATAGTWVVAERMLTELAFAELEALDDPHRAAGAVFGGDH